ncbi:1-acyl-sn-glycerol-3-phosphate acyltransferase [bacterium SCSIO 12741]|nr:1-acyl-sn-glycerol-3-phosphate acyltransferase [bacterium SCSIO 12741]
MRSFLKWGMGMQVENAEVLEGFSQAILVANHNSHLDTMGLLTLLNDQWLSNLRPVAARDYFAANKIKKWYYETLFNLLLVTRKRENRLPGENPIKSMVEVLDQGQSLLIFPEGTRGKPNVMESFKHGVSKVIQARPDVPVIPVFIDNSGMVLPGGSTLPLPFQFRIRFGSPRFLKPESTDQLTEKLYQAIIELKPEPVTWENPFQHLSEKPIL